MDGYQHGFTDYGPAPVHPELNPDYVAQALHLVAGVRSDVPLAIPYALLSALEQAVGTGLEPDGLCAGRGKHAGHLHDSVTLGRFWCTGDPADREPGRSERRRRPDPVPTVGWICASEQIRGPFS